MLGGNSDGADRNDDDEGEPPVKKRNRGARKRGYLASQWHSAFYAARARRSKAWIFEKLEERNYFSAAPISAGIVTSYSSNTPEGLQAILQRELAWAAAVQAQQLGTEVRGLTTYAAPTDPLFASQWHLLNTGQQVGSPDGLPIHG
jgi:hypothetical protein